MSEETKNTAPQPQEPETAPAAEPVKEAQTAEAPAAEEQDVPQDPKAKKEWFGKKAAKELAAEKARADAAEKAAAQAKDQLLRTAAEYDNFRRRSAKEQDAAFNNGVGFAVNQILTILDTLEMAANAACTDENYKKGVVMTLDKASAALTALKVEEIPAEGQPFDPNLHNAVMHTEDESLGENVLAQVFQKGFKIGDKVVRFAMVQVAN